MRRWASRSCATAGARRRRPMSPFDYIWLLFLLSSLQPLIQQRVLALRRAQALRALERRNHSRAITLIHRREGLAILGIPFGGYIDIEDSEALIRAIEMTQRDRPARPGPPAHAPVPAAAQPPALGGV